MAILVHAGARGGQGPKRNHTKNCTMIGSGLISCVSLSLSFYTYTHMCILYKRGPEHIRARSMGEQSQVARVIRDLSIAFSNSFSHVSLSE